MLSVENVEIVDPNELTRVLGKFFSGVSSDDNYSENFLLHKVEEEFQDLEFQPDDN